MKAVLFLLGCIVLAAFSWMMMAPAPRTERSAGDATTPAPTVVPTLPPAQNAVSAGRTTVYVPYWASFAGIAEDPADELSYFGITVNTDGVVTGDPGYAKLAAFAAAAGERPIVLTVRMLDRDVNTEIFGDPPSHRWIADAIAATATEFGFEGVILDLEVGLVSFHIAPASITAFANTVGKSLERENLRFAMTVYGDTFYRKRPYDIAALGRVADELHIMAYDFHKSFGTPGPNFPLSGREEYGYDFTTMIADFTKLVPPEKITVIYGMYGYEWNVDEQDRPSKSAEAVTLAQAEQRFGTGDRSPDFEPASCPKPSCTVRRDRASIETEVRYATDDNRTIVVWYEDDESVRRKREVMERAGVGNVAFWAYGYY